MAETASPDDVAAPNAAVGSAAEAANAAPAQQVRAMPALPPRNTSKAKPKSDRTSSSNSAGVAAAAAGVQQNGAVSNATSTSIDGAAAGSNGINSSSSSGGSSSGSRPAAVRLKANGSGSSVRAMPSLPARGNNSSGGSGRAGSNAGSACGEVVDAEESASTQALRLRVHDIRVQLIRASRRLGFEHDNGLVKQVLYRLYLAEKLKEPFRKGSRRPDAAVLAARDATRLEAQQGTGAPLDLNIKILVIGLRGTGKTQLIASLLGMSSSSDGSNGGSNGSSNGGSSAALEPFGGGTRRVQVHTGRALGVGLTLVDTPGLTSSAAGAGANAGILRSIKAAFKKHTPDLVLYVDRFDAPHSFGSDTCVLGAITRVCGPAIWLNTIVALTHAAAQPPASAAGTMSWDVFSSDRMQQLQHSIREASGDARLMNPIAFADSHPQCERNEQGQLVLPNGVAWQQHLLVLMVSAKLLADAEAAMQTHGDAAGGKQKRLGTGVGPVLDPASMRQLMGRPDGPPVRYLMTQLTGFSQPLTFPDHGSIMELRSAQQRLSRLHGWRERKELSRQIRFRMLQMRQMMRRQQRTSDLLCKATRAGGKLQLAQPRTATRVRPSVHPPVGHRYRTLEPAAGWIVRPQLEPHGMDNADSVEGFMAEKAGVMRTKARSSSSNNSSSSEPDLLSGLPYRVSSSMSASKDQMLVQGRGELSLYHDLPGLATSTLAADVQTSGAAAAGPSDMLVVVRLDSQRRGAPVAANNPAVGLMVARLCPGCAPHKGPLATGLRLQDCIRLNAPGGAPVELDVACGKMFCRSGMEPDDAWGANAELRTDSRQLLGSRYSAPLSVSGSVMGHRGERMAAVSAAMQVQQGRRGRVGGKLQVNSRGVASLALQLRSDRPQWWGLAGLVPLVSLGWQAVTSALARRRGEGQGGPDGQDGEPGGAWDEQQQQQQYMPEELAQLLQQHQAAVLHQQQ